MRYDIENAVADLMKAYLARNIDPDIIAQSPVVTFYDPMSVDEANRIVVQVPDGQTRPEQMGSGIVTVEIGIKSQWTQPTIKDDFAAHFARVKEVREKLFLDMESMLQAIDAAAGQEQPPITGIEIDGVNGGRKLHTDVREGWLYTETGFEVSYFTTADN